MVALCFFFLIDCLQDKILLWFIQLTLSEVSRKKKKQKDYAISVKEASERWVCHTSAHTFDFLELLIKHKLVKIAKHRLFTLVEFNFIVAWFNYLHDS